MFNLDDLHYLVLSSRRVIDFANFDLSKYKKVLEDNKLLLKDLMDKVTVITDLISDNDIKKRILYNLKKKIENLYLYFDNKDLKKQYNGFNGSNIGYFSVYPDKDFIQNDYCQMIEKYSNIIEFLIYIYQKFKIAENKNLPEQKHLYEIYNLTRVCCEKMGIHSADEDTLYNQITSNPDCENVPKFLDIDSVIIEDDFLEKDILIESIPYSVTCPNYSSYGEIAKYEFVCNNPKVFYNKSYIDSLREKQLHEKSEINKKVNIIYDDNFDCDIKKETQNTIIDENGIIYDTNGNMIGFIENGTKFITDFDDDVFVPENDIENETHHIR